MDATNLRGGTVTHFGLPDGCHGVTAPCGPASKEAPAACEPAAACWPHVEAPGLAVAAERRRARRTALSLRAGWRGEVLGAAGFSFCVRDFCATGLQIVAPGHDALRGVGQRLRARLQVPGVDGPIAVRLMVRRVEAHDTLAGPEGRYGVQLEVDGARARSRWSQALLQHPAEPNAIPTPARLRAEGFAVTAPARSMRYVTVHGGALYDEVLMLRWQCSRDGGLLGPGQLGPRDLSDACDGAGQVVAALHHGSVVATFRVHAPGPQEPLALEAWLEQPERLPPRDAVVECTRLAIHAQYRGHDLAEAQCQLSARYALAHGRRYLVLGTNAKLAAYYAQYGAQDTGLRGTYHGIPSRALLVDLARFAQSGSAKERRAVYGAPPLLDGKVPPMPRFRRQLMRVRCQPS